MATRSNDPFDLPLNPEQRKALGLFLCDELQKGLDARASHEQDVDYWHQQYEQARTRQGRNAPWPDAADLTSYLACEKADAIHARLMDTVWVTPIWSVEGWGEAANRAPFVEEFTQWKAEEGRLQSAIDKLALISLIEPRGLLEVYEGTEMRVTRKRVMAKVKTDPLTGGMLYNEDLDPDIEYGPDGKVVVAGAMDIAAETVVDERARVRTGPVERIIPYRDSVILPGHARDKEEIWGYGKRLWRRYADLKRQAEAGVYDKEAIRLMTETGDKEPDQALQRSGHTVAPSESTTAEKELWEVLVLLDLNEFFPSMDLKKLKGADYDGARWYLCTLHVQSQQLLRAQHDDLERSRFVLVNLFPRPDRATEGFSLIGHKLGTILDEHTAWRNMAADRAAMIVQAPVKRLVGALWDPYEQPWGPRAVIDVRQMEEIQPVEVPDYTASVMNHIQMCEQTAERVVGVNDISAGQVSSESRTLGEVQMATAASEIRMKQIIRRFQESMEDIAQIRHAILKRTVAEAQDGIEPPQSMMASLEGRGVDIMSAMPDKKVTAELLEGVFRFKPRGSVETADPLRQQQQMVSMVQMLPALLQMFPFMGPMFQTPQAARAMGREFLKIFRVENTQAFLGSPAQDLMQTQALDQMGGFGGLLGGMGMGQPGMLPPPQAPLMAPSTNTLQ
jgi:hypothetical protein